MKKILSWDCAHRSLAWIQLTIDVEKLLQAKQNIKNRLENPVFDAKTLKLFITQQTDLMRQVVVCESIGVVDLLGKNISETNEIDRTRSLYLFLKNSVLNKKKISKDTIILIEKQPSKLAWGKTNSKSSAVADQLQFYYTCFETHMCSPKNKNKLEFSADLKIESFLKNYKNKYTARKKHAEANFLYFLKCFKTEKVIANIPKCTLHNAADAAMQAFAYYSQLK